MASNFAFHPTVNEVVPYSAQYSFPSQATRQSKRTVKLTPKNNSAIYSSGSVIRYEFPASGYLNPNTTYLGFNVNVKVGGATPFANGATLASGFEFQQGIQSVFRRLRILYGSLVLEDIQDYNILQRIFTETVLPTGSLQSSNAIYQGLGPSRRNINTTTNFTAAPYAPSYSRFNYHSTSNEDTPANWGITSRRYHIPINSGLFQQHNLLPLKFMASQLSIELEIADAVDCCICVLGTGAGATVPTALTVQVGLPELVSELLEFDSDFDQAIYNVMEVGLPIYYQSWHVTTQNVTPNLTVQLNVQESARSVRYALAVILDDNNRTLRRDAHHFIAGLQATAVDAIATDNGSTSSFNQSALESYQWRLGGTYYPSQPVAVMSGNSGPNIIGVDANYSDPPIEAYAELMKVFGNMFADDGTYFGDQRLQYFSEPRHGTALTDTFQTTAFVMAGNFMSDRGDIISGINAEEQNDLQLIMKFVGTTNGTTKTAKIVTCFDNMIILGQSNNLTHVN